MSSLLLNEHIMWVISRIHVVSNLKLASLDGDIRRVLRSRLKCVSVCLVIHLLSAKWKKRREGERKLKKKNNFLLSPPFPNMWMWALYSAQLEKQFLRKERSSANASPICHPCTDPEVLSFPQITHSAFQRPDLPTNSPTQPVLCNGTTPKMWLDNIPGTSGTICTLSTCLFTCTLVSTCF